ncbi:MAG: hypothetical protein ACJ8R9_11310 [Steroidobacteraceae bacterium]
MSAVQELIGAIQFGDADVARFEVGDYDLYLFAIKRPSEANNTTLKDGPRKPVKARSWEPSALIPRARALLDNIIDGACRQSKVGRDELASKAKSKPLSFARALIAYYANLSGTASYAQVASMMRLHPNSLHLSIRRFRQVVPHYFNMSVEEFLTASEIPTNDLAALMGEPWAKANVPAVASDAEIGTRIAKALEVD